MQFARERVFHATEDEGRDDAVSERGDHDPAEPDAAHGGFSVSPTRRLWPRTRLSVPFGSRGKSAHERPQAAIRRSRHNDDLPIGTGKPYFRLLPKRSLKF